MEWFRVMVSVDVERYRSQKVATYVSGNWEEAFMHTQKRIVGQCGASVDRRGRALQRDEPYS